MVYNSSHQDCDIRAAVYDELMMPLSFLVGSKRQT